MKRKKQLTSAEKRKLAQAKSGEKAVQKEPFSLKKWFIDRPILQFAGIFAVLGTFFYSLMLTPFYTARVFPVIVNVNARLSSFFLNLVGEGSVVSGSSISSSRFSLSIAQGCDAMEPIIFYAAVVLSFPAPWKKKLIGLFGGVAVLFLINQVRIISLYYIGIYANSLFHFMHVDFWQVAFIILGIAFWIYWIRWTLKTQAPIKNEEV